MGQGPGPQTWRCFFSHLVSGVTRLLTSVVTLQTCLGHLSHLRSVEYPMVTSLHFSTCMITQLGLSSSTSCTWYEVRHSDSKTGSQTSGPGSLQLRSKTSLQISTSSSSARFLYSITQCFSKMSSHISIYFEAKQIKIRDC